MPNYPCKSNPAKIIRTRRYRVVPPLRYMLKPILERKYAIYLAQAGVTLNGDAPIATAGVIARLQTAPSNLQSVLPDEVCRLIPLALEPSCGKS